VSLASSLMQESPELRSLPWWRGWEYHLRLKEHGDREENQGEAQVRKGGDMPSSEVCPKDVVKIWNRQPTFRARGGKPEPMVRTSFKNLNRGSSSSRILGFREAPDGRKRSNALKRWWGRKKEAQANVQPVNYYGTLRNRIRVVNKVGEERKKSKGGSGPGSNSRGEK